MAEFAYDRKNSFTTVLPQFRIQLREQSFDGSAAILGKGGSGAGQHGIEAGGVVLHPRRHHRTLNQVPLIDFEVGSFDHGDPSVLIGIAGEQARIAQHIVVDRGDDAFDGREQIDTGVAAGQSDELLSLTNPAVGSANINLIDLCPSGW